MYIRTLFTDLLYDFESWSEVLFLILSEESKRSLGRQVSREHYLMSYWGRVLGVFGGGFLALVPEQSYKGDILNIAKGSEVPFVLRPCENGNLIIYWGMLHSRSNGRRILELCQA